MAEMPEAQRQDYLSSFLDKIDGLMREMSEGDMAARVRRMARLNEQEREDFIRLTVLAQAGYLKTPAGMNLLS